jgi:adenosylcobinamide-phosphate synthase
VDHVRAVAEGCAVAADGRRAVSMIVGRDTRELDEAAVARAAIESAAENLSDGVVAPAFWFLWAGLPGILLYKIVNTADSMIGHRTERHGDFGWAAARLDDVLNWLPARLTACLIAVTRRRPGALRIAARDGPCTPLRQCRLAGGRDGAQARPRAVGSAQLRRRDDDGPDPQRWRPAGGHGAGHRRRDTILWRVWGAVFLTTLIRAAI